MIAGHDRDDVMAMLLPEVDAIRNWLGQEAEGKADAEILTHPKLRAEIGGRLTQIAREATGSSTRVARVLFLVEPPSIDANEITDKGSINQRAVLTRRAAFVEALYANPPLAEAISAG